MTENQAWGKEVRLWGHIPVQKGLWENSNPQCAIRGTFLKRWIGVKCTKAEQLLYIEKSAQPLIISLSHLPSKERIWTMGRFISPLCPHPAQVVMQPGNQALTPSLTFHSLNPELLRNKFTYWASAPWQHEVGNGKGVPFSGKWHIAIEEFISRAVWWNAIDLRNGILTGRKGVFFSIISFQQERRKMLLFSFRAHIGCWIFP